MALQFPGLDPAALTLPAFEAFGAELGPFSIRWYGLAYLAAAILGSLWMRRLIATPSLWRADQAKPDPQRIDDFVYLAFFAAIIGGRIGYILFYLLPDPGSRAHIAADPLTLLRIWEGGLSFHGGFVGLVLAAFWFAHKYRLNVPTFGDLIAAAIPIGIFLVRIANFINGELYGRHSNAPWAMVFPEGGYNWDTREWIWTGHELPRHPSQLYEAGLEGALLFTLIAVATYRFKSLQRPGLNIGIFLVGYGLCRFALEFVRQPDAQMPDALQGYLTMGMLLSTPMALVGAWLLWRVWRTPRTA